MERIAVSVTHRCHVEITDPDRIALILEDCRSQNPSAHRIAQVIEEDPRYYLGNTYDDDPYVDIDDVEID